MVFAKIGGLVCQKAGENTMTSKRLPWECVTRVTRLASGECANTGSNNTSLEERLPAACRL